MRTLSTPRLHLVPLSAEIVRRRLLADDFEAVLDLPDGARTVSFGPQWPGPALGSYAGLLEVAAGGEVPWRYVVLDRDAPHTRAIGDVGAREPVADDGSVRVGCLIDPDAQGRGLGTEAIGAVLAELLSHESIDVVRSHTGPDDMAGQRVLENNGFSRVGSVDDPERGHVVLWECRA